MPVGDSDGATGGRVAGVGVGAMLSALDAGARPLPPLPAVAVSLGRVSLPTPSPGRFTDRLVV